MLKYATILLSATWWVETAQSRHVTTHILQARNDTEPCAQVSSAWAAQKAANASATVVVDGQLAYDCLNSVPLQADDAVRLVRSIQPFLEWQSSEYQPDSAIPKGDCLHEVPQPRPTSETHPRAINFLVRVYAGVENEHVYCSTYPRTAADPLDIFTAFDIETAFNDIITNVQSGQYQNEYEFQSDLYLTFPKAKDGHLVSILLFNGSTWTNMHRLAILPRFAQCSHCISSR